MADAAQGLSLAGRRILVTRGAAGRDVLAARLRRLGAEPLEFPVFAIVEPADWGPVDRALGHLHDYDWLVFTSQNGVDAVLDRATARGLTLPELGGPLVAAVGEATAVHLAQRGLPPDLVPGEYSGQGVLAALSPRLDPGSRVLLTRGDLASPLLPDGLRQAGARVDEVVVYRNVPNHSRAAELRAMLAAGGVDAVTFASSSAVANLLEMLGSSEALRLLGTAWVACIGPQTAGTAARLGLRVDVVPETATLPALADALAAALGPK